MRVGVPHGPLAELPQLDGFMAPHQLVRSRWRCRRDTQLEALLAWGRKPSGRWAEAWRKSEAYRCGAVKMVFSAPASLRGTESFSCSLISRIYYDATRPSELMGCCLSV